MPSFGREDQLDVRVRLLDARLAQVEAAKTEKSITRIGRGAQTAGKHAKEGGKGFGLFGSALGGIRYAAATVGIGGLAFGIKDAVQAGISWQEQQAQLRNSLRATHQSISQVKTITDAVEQSSTHGGFAAPSEIQAVTQFTRLLGSSSLAVKQNAEAIELARGAHMSYEQAVKAVSQADIGRTRGLARFVGAIIPVTSHVNALTAAQKKQHPELLKQAQLLDKQATAAEANSAVLKKFGGATAAYGKTAAGAMSNAQNAFHRASVQVGTQLLPLVTKLFLFLAKVAPKILPGLNSIVKVFKQHRTAAIALGIVVGTVLTGWVAYGAAIRVVSVVTKAWTVATKLASAAMWLLNLALDANPVVLIIVALVALGVAFVVLYKRSEKFRHAVQKTLQWLKNAAQNTAKAVTAAFQWISNAATNTAHWVSKAFHWLVDSITYPFRRLYQVGKSTYTWIKNAAHNTVEWVAGKFRWLADKLTWPFRQMYGWAKKAFGWVKNAAHNVGHFIGHPFGLNAGGLVPHFATGGPIGGSGSTDNQLIAATPGEFMLRKQIVQAVGVQNLQRWNSGGSPPGGPMQIEPGITRVYLDGRVIAEATTHYQLKKQARR